MIWENKNNDTIYKMGLANGATFDFLPIQTFSKIEDCKAIVTNKTKTSIYLLKDEDDDTIIKTINGRFTIEDFDDTLFITSSQCIISNDKKRLFNILKKNLFKRLDAFYKQMNGKSRVDRIWYDFKVKNVKLYYEKMRTKILNT